MADADGNPERPYDTRSQISISTTSLDELRAITRLLTKLNKEYEKQNDITTKRLDREVARDHQRSTTLAQDLHQARLRLQPPGTSQAAPGGTLATPFLGPLATPTEVSAWQRVKSAVRDGEGGFRSRLHTFLEQPEPLRFRQGGTSGGGGPGMPPRGPRGPGGGGSGMPPSSDDRGNIGPSTNRTPSAIFRGMSEEQVNTMMEQGIRIPQFGEWQLDDKLAMGRNLFGRFAMARVDDSGNITTAPGRAAADIAGVLNYGHAQAGQMVAANRLYRGIHSRGEALTQVGADLGYGEYNPGLGPGVIPGLGERNFLDYVNSDAAKQALGLQWDASRMARQHGTLDKKTAEEVYGAVAAQGWSNQRAGGVTGRLDWKTEGHAEDIATNLVAPLVKETGAAPADIAQFTTFLRSGGVSLNQLADSLKGLGNAAHASNQTISAYSNSLFQFTEQMQTQFGAGKAQGESLGISYTTATGLDPQILAKSMANPMYQGLALGKYGVLPGALGAINPGLAGMNQTDMLKMLQGATGGLNHDQMTTVDGIRVGSVSGSDQQLGMMSQMSGLPVNDIRRLLDPKVQAANRALAVLGRHDVTNSYDQLAARDKKLGRTAGRDAREQNEWGVIVDDAKKAHVSQTDINNASAEHDPVKRSQDLRAALAKVANPVDDSNKVTVGFTGYADKFFQQVFNNTDPKTQAKANRDAGGTPTTAQAISPGQAAAFNWIKGHPSS